MIAERLQKVNAWPEWLAAHHVQRLQLTTESTPSIAKILSNVNQPWREHKGCTCEKVKQQLRAAGYKGTLPTIDGHIFFIGREYDGPFASVLKHNSGGIPNPTKWDLEKAWEGLYDQLPRKVRELDDRPALDSKASWKRELKQCTMDGLWGRIDRSWPCTRDAYRLRKVLDGLTIGPLDKNTGECWCCCPKLYDQALEGMYNAETGYKQVFPRRATTYQRRKHGKEMYKHIFSDVQVRNRERGDEKEVVKAMEHFYKSKGWNKYATFNRKGGFNKPYILFKAKNVTDPEVRQRKWKKVRPIAPGTRHPMRRLLGLAGRAWSFITSHLPGEHFVTNKVQDVPTFLREVEAEFRGKGELKHVIRDIEGCFPNMPKDAIRLGLRDWAKRIQREWGHQGVWVPKYSKAQPCTWKAGGRKHARVWLNFDVLLEIMEFSLDNACVKMQDGRILKQLLGIPMGDPISPGMTVGGCAWMENEWMQTLTSENKQMFRARRFMDDILLWYVDSPQWDSQAFLRDFEQSTCYWDPLKLEPGSDGVFLETAFECNGDQITYRLKNPNEAGGDPKVWRYQHFSSYGGYSQKRATLFACLRKVHAMASDEEQLKISALAKLREFERLAYPVGIRKFACAVLARDTECTMWWRVRAAQM